MTRALMALSVVLALSSGVLAASLGQDLPYTTIDHPQFVPASQATFLSDRDRVIGVADGNVAKTYPAAILAQHGVVQDQVAAGPIAVTW